MAQARVPVLPGDDAETLAARVLAEEHRIYPAGARAKSRARRRADESRAAISPADLR